LPFGLSSPFIKGDSVFFQTDGFAGFAKQTKKATYVTFSKLIGELDKTL
jgi:hypothetical protein